MPSFDRARIAIDRKLPEPDPRDSIRVRDRSCAVAEILDECHRRLRTGSFQLRHAGSLCLALF